MKKLILSMFMAFAMLTACEKEPVEAEPEPDADCPTILSKHENTSYNQTDYYFELKLLNSQFKKYVSPTDYNSYKKGEKYCKQ